MALMLATKNSKVAFWFFEAHRQVFYFLFDHDKYTLYDEQSKL